jgi:hypothetical protein
LGPATLHPYPRPPVQQYWGSVVCGFKCVYVCVHACVCELCGVCVWYASFTFAGHFKDANFVTISHVHRLF